MQWQRNLQCIALFSLTAIQWFGLALFCLTTNTTILHMKDIFRGSVQQKSLGEREALSVSDPPTVESCQIVHTPTSYITAICHSIIKISYRYIRILVLDLFQGKRTEDVSTRHRAKCCVGLAQNGGSSSYQDDQMGAHWEGGLGRRGWGGAHTVRGASWWGFGHFTQVLSDWGILFQSTVSMYLALTVITAKLLNC